MHDRDADRHEAEPHEGQPYRARLPGFVTDESIGLGDALARGSHTFGVTPCDGCRRRAAALNRWLVFTGRAR